MLKVFISQIQLSVRDLKIEMINADNLPRIIFNLKKKNPDKFELLKDVYFQLFPDIEDIIVENIQIDSVGDEQFPEDVPFIFTNSIYVLFVRDKIW
mgnify:CR=1 FL=1